MTWTVEPAGVVNVDGGTVTAIGEGDAVITATIRPPDSEPLTAQAAVSVSEAPTLSLNRASWTLDPTLPESDKHGAVYLEGKTTGTLDDTVVLWRIEPTSGPRVLWPRDADEETPVDPYTDEGIQTPFATPTKIRWNYRPDVYGTDTGALTFPIEQTAVCSLTTGGLTIEATCDITITEP